MNENKPKTPKKGAVKRMRDHCEKNRGKASTELREILKTPSEANENDKKSAIQKIDKDAEL